MPERPTFLELFIEKLFHILLTCISKTLCKLKPIPDDVNTKWSVMYEWVSL